MRVLVDTNVLLDALIGRQPYFDNADKILKLCADKKVIGCMADHSITSVFYILRKDFGENDRQNILLNICDILLVEGTDSVKVISSLKNKDFDDFEDCLQSECAVCVSLDYIFTRNIKDFSPSLIPAILPGDFLKISGFQA